MALALLDVLDALLRLIKGHIEATRRPQPEFCGFHSDLAALALHSNRFALSLDLLDVTQLTLEPSVPSLTAPLPSTKWATEYGLVD
jgi:hypothetical protein